MDTDERGRGGRKDRVPCVRKSEFLLREVGLDKSVGTSVPSGPGDKKGKKY